MNRMVSRLCACLVAFSLFAALCGGMVARAADGFDYNYTYTYDYWGDERQSPDAYRTSAMLSSVSLGLETPMRTPRGLTVSGNDIYIVDTGNNRILQVARDGESFTLTRVISEISGDITPNTLSAPQFPFKKFWFAAVIITVIIPPQTISSSLYLHFNFFDIFGIFKATTGSSLNLRGSPIPYALMSATCMGLKNGLYIYMIRQFFTGIPKSLEEAAYVDGCSIFKTFWRVILPDAVPILVSCFLFSFVWQWTDTFYSKLFLGNIKLLSLEASTVADRLNSYVSIQLGLSGGASMGYQQQMVL